MKFKFTEEHINYIKNNYLSQSVQELADNIGCTKC